MKNSIKNSSAFRVARETAEIIIKRYFEHNVGKHGAAMAYYLLFAIFPLMIFVSSVIGQLDLDIGSIIGWAEDILPADITAIIEEYLEYVSVNSNGSVLGFSLVFTLYFPFRATKSLMSDVRRAYDLKKPARPISYRANQVAYTLVLFVVIALSLILLTIGKRVIGYINDSPRIQIPQAFIGVWNYLRFFVVALFMFCAIVILYALAQDKKQPLREVIPGAVAALIVWLSVSIVFSFYVENFGKYSAIYGALGAVMVLLLWLYMTSVILILGAEFNRALCEAKSHPSSLR